MEMSDKEKQDALVDSFKDALNDAAEEISVLKNDNKYLLNKLKQMSLLVCIDEKDNYKWSGSNQVCKELFYTLARFGIFIIDDDSEEYGVGGWFVDEPCIEAEKRLLHNLRL